MASCFEVAMALLDADYINGDDLDTVTTVLVETLLATGTIKERSQAIDEKEKDEKLYEAAEYVAGADDAMGNYEDIIEQMEIMLDAKERQIQHEEIIFGADEIISQNARLATATLLEKKLIPGGAANQARELIARTWAAA